MRPWIRPRPLTRRLFAPLAFALLMCAPPVVAATRVLDVAAPVVASAPAHDGDPSVPPSPAAVPHAPFRVTVPVPGSESASAPHESLDSPVLARPPGRDWWEQARRSIEADQLRFQPSTDGWVARTRHDLRVDLEDAALSVRADASSWRWNLHGATLERDGVRWIADTGLLDAAGSDAIRSTGWGEERFHNRQEGLEHAFRIDVAPPGMGALSLDVDLETTLLCDDTGEEGLEFWSDDRVALVYRGLVVRDALGREVPARLSCLEAGMRIEIDDADAAYPLEVDPLITTSPWTPDPTGQASAYFGYSVAGAGDVDGDGYHDVIVGAYGYSSGSYSQEGRAYLFRGTSAGLESTAAWALDPVDVASAQFGYAVATAGDVNGDGFADVLVGAPGYTAANSKQGRAYLFLGSTAGLAQTADWQYSPSVTNAAFGSSVASAGDVNGDGLSDIVIGAPGYLGNVGAEGRAFLFYGTSSGVLATSPEWYVDPADQANAAFGASVASAGDVNGDGYSDVVIGAFKWGNLYASEGRAFLFLGSATGLSTSSSWTVDPANLEDANFGYSVSGAGDVNGDGYADIAVGARFDGSAKAGRVYLYLGSSSGPSTTASWTGDGVASSSFGSSVAGPGDVNGDGFADILVGAPNWTDGTYTKEGRAYLYLGSRTGPGSKADTTIDAADGASAYFGISVAGAGDVNGDGFNDAVVGASGWTGTASSEGRAWLFLGTAVGPGTTPSTTSDPTDQNNSGFGSAVALAGDVNGDGYGDVVVGASTWTSSSYLREGAVYLFLGSSSGVSISPAWHSDPANQIDSRFGYAVAGAGDVNADGYADFVVGAYQATGTSVQEGKAYLFLGSSALPSTTPDWVVEPANKATARFGISVTGAGDVNGDGYADVAVGCSLCGTYQQGRVYLYYGSTTGLSTTAAWSAEPTETARNEFGTDVAGAGDVNGDGYADLVVGAPYYDSTNYVDEGRAYVYLGAASTPSTTPVWTLDPVDQPSAYYGTSVAGAGDVNGDGYDDIAVGAPSATGNYSYEGIAYLYQGSAGGPATTASWTGEPADVTSSQFGLDIAGAGDVNGDGYADLAVLAPKWAGPDTDDQGRAYLFLGTVSGLSSTAVWTLDNDAQPQASVGLVLAGRGDVNGDTFSDLVIGDQYFAGNSYGTEGRMYVFVGGDLAPGQDRMLLQYRDDGTTLVGTGARVPSNAVVLSMLLGAPSTRGSRVFLEAEVKPIGTRFDGTGLTASSLATVSGTATVQVTFGGLVDGTRYHWRARLVDAVDGSSSRWLSYGANRESSADFWYHFIDSDGDGLDDLVDNCPRAANADQNDEDYDGLGDTCDACPVDPLNDDDGDGVCYSVDNCPDAANADQADSDGDLAGDVCDTCPNDADDDADADGVCGDADNCVDVPNADQADGDGDGIGDLCDTCAADADNDADGDGVCGDVDNCPGAPNADQADVDGDSTGDACDTCQDDGNNDADGDGVCGDLDNCPAAANSGQADADGDGVGDACDSCPADPDNDIDQDGKCGDLDNCPAAANSDQADGDGDGTGDVCDLCPADAADDADGDGVCADVDNCPSISNADQADTDGDGPGDVCDVCAKDAANDADGDGVCADVDNCPSRANSDQADADKDHLGNVCDTCTKDPYNDADGDGKCGDVDNCSTTSNSDQADGDGDKIGDACDVCPADATNDADGDGVCGGVDDCPSIANADQADADGDGVGDVCDTCPTDPGNDTDGDGVCYLADNCPTAANVDQADGDGDGAGEVCDDCPEDPDNDKDGDGVCGDVDNCPAGANEDQADADHDGLGDSCDACPADDLNDVDGDGVCGDADNCPSEPNPEQGDADGNGVGDACAEEVCDGLDNDGNGTIDDGFDDQDADGRADCVDRCPSDPDNDVDGDSVCGDVDLCADIADPGQIDADEDGAGDACDVCPEDPSDDEDGDGVCGGIDNCPAVPNEDQADSDGDGVGDACMVLESPTPSGDDDSPTPADDSPTPVDDSPTPADDSPTPGDDDSPPPGDDDSPPPGDDDVTDDGGGDCSCDTTAPATGRSSMGLVLTALALGGMARRRGRLSVKETSPLSSEVTSPLSS